MVWVSLVYRASLIEIKNEEYDPFAVLDIDLEASISEIRQIYHVLIHPGSGGDPEKFKEIVKAYKTWTTQVNQSDIAEL